MTAETRKKISEANKGKQHSDETKKKLSLLNKGKKHTEEAKRKMSEIKNKRKTELGYINSLKTREKISIAHKGKVPWNKGKKYSVEARLKISEGHKGQIPWNKGRTGISAETRKKMSIAGKNRPPISEETRRKIGEAEMGEKHPNWQGGISKLPYSFQFNKELKELIRNRDNYKCQLCGCPQRENLKRLAVHHIDYDKQNSLPSNLITLCTSCNSKVNFQRAKWQEYFSNQSEALNVTNAGNMGRMESKPSNTGVPAKTK